MAERTKVGIIVGNKTGALTRPFLPSIDIVEPVGSVPRELSEADKSTLLATKAPTSRASRSAWPRAAPPWVPHRPSGRRSHATDLRLRGV